MDTDLDDARHSTSDLLLPTQNAPDANMEADLIANSSSTNPAMYVPSSTQPPSPSPSVPTSLAVSVPVAEERAAALARARARARTALAPLLPLAVIVDAYSRHLATTAAAAARSAIAAAVQDATGERSRSLAHQEQLLALATDWGRMHAAGAGTGVDSEQQQQQGDCGQVGDCEIDGLGAAAGVEHGLPTWKTLRMVRKFIE